MAGMRKSCLFAPEARLSKLFVRLTFILCLLCGLALQAEMHSHDNSRAHDPNCAVCRALDAPPDAPPSAGGLHPITWVDSGKRIQLERTHLPEAPVLGTLHLRGPPSA
jgi:hypothetical protein